MNDVIIIGLIAAVLAACYTANRSHSIARHHMRLTSSNQQVVQGTAVPVNTKRGARKAAPAASAENRVARQSRPGWKKAGRLALVVAAAVGAWRFFGFSQAPLALIPVALTAAVVIYVTRVKRVTAS